MRLEEGLSPIKVKLAEGLRAEPIVQEANHGATSGPGNPALVLPSQALVSDEIENSFEDLVVRKLIPPVRPAQTEILFDHGISRSLDEGAV